jgi:triacylglycerol lipase
MERKELLKFAKIAATTYEDPKTSRKKFQDQGYDIVEFFNFKGAQAYLLKGQGGEHVLSFRGTEVTEPSDVLADLKAGKNTETVLGGKVHSGFRSEINKLWPSIERAVANIDAIYVTGHSLGAAMATIAANRLRKKVQALITFGSPRVGDKRFVNSLDVPHMRVQNNCDDVTKVPPYLMGFRHHGTHRYMNYYGQFRSLTTWQRVKDMIRSRVKGRVRGKRFLGIKDHLMNNYIEKLKKGE